MRVTGSSVEQLEKGIRPTLGIVPPQTMYPRLSRCPGNPNFIYAELVPDCPGIERTEFAPTKKDPRAAARGYVLQIALLLLDEHAARVLHADEAPLVVARRDSRPGVPGLVNCE